MYIRLGCYNENSISYSPDTFIFQAQYENYVQLLANNTAIQYLIVAFRIPKQCYKLQTSPTPKSIILYSSPRLCCFCAGKGTSDNQEKKKRGSSRGLNTDSRGKGSGKLQTKRVGGAQEMSTLKFFHVCGNIAMILISYLAYPSRMNRAVDSVFIWIHTISQQNFK